MTELIARWGLIGVFAGAAVEGDVLLILVGVAAHLGLLRFPTAAPAAFAGMLFGDSVWYLVGRWRGEAIRGSRIYRAVGPSVERLSKRLGVWQVAVSRFFQGTRMATMLFSGVHRMPFARFLAVDALGAAIWVVLLVGLGWAGSNGAVLLIGEVERAERWLLGALVVAVIVVVVARRLERPRE